MKIHLDITLAGVRRRDVLIFFAVSHKLFCRQSLLLLLLFLVYYFNRLPMTRLGWRLVGSEDVVGVSNKTLMVSPKKNFRVSNCI